MVKRLVSLLLAGMLVFSVFAALSGCGGAIKSIDDIKKTRAFLLGDDTISSRWNSYGGEDIAAEAIFDASPITIGSAADADFDIRESGDYSIFIEYAPVEKNIFENQISVLQGNEEVICSLPFLWADDISAEFKTDRYGNETVPGQIELPVNAKAWLEDSNNFSRRPFKFHFEAGKNTLQITPLTQDLKLVSLKAVKYEEPVPYSEYIRQFDDAKSVSSLITIEAENYRAKSDSYIRGTNVPNTSVAPNDPYIKLINATDDKSNKTIGQKLLYEVDITESGRYDLSFKYCQPLKAGGPVYRTLEVDGRVPFAEARDIPFVHTGMDTYANYTLGNENPMQIYLSAGIHTIALKVTAGPMDGIYKELLQLVNEINDTGLLIKKIRGSNSDNTALIDKNRIWDITRYIPDIMTNLEDWRDRLENIYGELREISGMEPSFASDLMLASQNLERLESKPEEIPSNLFLLCDDSSSAAQLVSLTLTKIFEQNLSLDRLYLHGSGTVLPDAGKNILGGVANGVTRFIHSFSPEMNESVSVKNTAGTLTVWMNKPFQYVDALRELTAQDFTEKTGVNVAFSIMPDENKITLANSTGSNPDVALGLGYYRPSEFAMRGMAKNLLEYPDFLDWYGAEYNLESLSPMAYEDGVYGASETQDFYVLFYRKDILGALGLEIPETWDDVKKMMPELLRNSMNFNSPLANNVAYKSFDTTGGFIFQNGGNYYSPDGFSSNFNDPATLKGLREMTDLFRIYGVVQNVPNFFNAFRSGSVPIGISNFTTYLQLQIGAPELAGRWDIALMPGTLQADGTISRYYSADTTSAMIFSNSRMPDEAYAFLKWWLSSETQTAYAAALQTRYGPDYIWNTANHAAFAQMPYPAKHKDIILEQWSWQKEALRHPASYILEREVSNAWIDIVTNGAEFQPRIDKAILAANNEMKRRLTEFGYYDDNGNKAGEYNVHLIDQLIERQKEKGAVLIGVQR